MSDYGHPTHQWSGPQTDWRCWQCDCRPGGRVAQFPCGEEPAGALTVPFPLIDMLAEAPEREPGGIA